MTASSWSTLSTLEEASLPEGRREVAMPVPKPSSSKAPLGLEAARQRKSDPGRSSEASENQRSPSVDGYCSTAGENEDAKFVHEDIENAS